MSAGSPTPPSRDSFCVARPERGDQGSAWSGTGTGADTDTDPDSDVDMDMFWYRVPATLSLSQSDSLLSSDSRFTDYRGILNWIIILLTAAEYRTSKNLKANTSNMFPIIALLLERCQDKLENEQLVPVLTHDLCFVPDLYYFLLAPTLCYQWDFPRTSSIRINFLLQRVLEMVMLTQLMVGIVQQWIGPIFQRSASPFSNMDVTTRIEHMVELVAPSHFLWLILFFLFSHSWLNFSGELLCFGDRHFYGDWWNAETLRSFWRKWSVPFHKWTYRHLYRPLMKKKVAPQQAEVLIFLLSAAVFEYVFAMSLRTCRFWIFSIMILELLVAVFLGHYFTGNYGNGLVWLCLLLGPPLAVMCYFHDYYMSHHGQPPWTLY
ncbi:hypothetical protein Z043_102632 [Scleropages formosus]|uniref:diacylglycerol O-acyltransferase n=1 Tax=Scleropages formosus TaxID=113540 RepID=A0A0P7V6Y6_SCLFO|nr:hypothetical protein Z043_102632 [Scleropages formosus]